MSHANLGSHRGAAVYARMGTETAALSASPHQLITMLFDGAATAIGMARVHMAQGRIKEKGESISKAIDIVDNGLKASLDPDAGGADGARLAGNLSALYDYVVRRLLYANLHNDSAALDEAVRLLGDVASAWREIAASATGTATVTAAHAPLAA